MTGRQALDGIETATILKPGDRVLITVGDHWTRQDMDEADALLRERMPDTTFVFVANVESVIVEPAEEPTP